VLPLLLVWRICVAGQAPKKTSKVKAVAVLYFHRGGKWKPEAWFRSA